MSQAVIKVDGMACEHCVKAVKTAVGALEGVSTVEVDLEGGLVTVEYDPGRTSVGAMNTAIEDQGYDIVA